MLDQSQIFSVKEVTNYIKTLLDNNPQLSDIWIKGEISNYTYHSSGHMYFTLKDESSRLRSIMFAGNNRYLKFIPKNGMKVIARGYISLFERDGQYQFYIQEMQPDGIGELYIAFEQLKEKLEKEGLFDPLIKKKLPSFPRAIGIITSSTGAAIRDMITTIKRRFPFVEIIIFPVLVQGEGAAKSIAYGIKRLNDYGGIDLIIVGRGGGSIEELWAFNEEIVARSIYESQLPVISAVGHETDFTIADFVADIRAATPTAAAELAVPHLDEVKARISFLANRLERQVFKQYEQAKNTLYKALKSIVFRRPKQYLLADVQRVDRLEERLNRSLEKQTSDNKERLTVIMQRLLQERPDQKIKNKREKLNYLRKQLLRDIRAIKDINEKRLDNKIGMLDALSPLKVMRRGYAIAFDESDKKLIRSIKNVELGDILKLHLYDGKLDCQVWSMEEKQNEPK